MNNRYKQISGSNKWFKHANLAKSFEKFYYIEFENQIKVGYGVKSG